MRYRSRQIEPVDLVSILPPGGYLWTRDGDGLAAWGRAALVEVGTGSDRFERAAGDLAEAFSSISRNEGDPPPIAFGSFTFDPDEPGSFLAVPEVIVRSDENGTVISVVGDTDVPNLVEREAGVPVKVRYAGSAISEVEWLDVVERGLKEIRSGQVEKVVLARDLAIWAESDFDLPLLLKYLASAYPTCYTFCCEGLLGATPELLIRRTGASVESLVLAGTAARSTDPEEDERFGRDLLASAKDHSEHEPSVDSVVRVLDPLCDRLETDPEPHLLRLANVQHLATRVTGSLAGDVTSLELAGALHPTAAVCGRPTEDARTLIRSLEGMSRGRYAGPVGWVDADGNGEWGIALRCAQIDGARGRLFAGGGVVAASEPEAELEETRLKFRAMMSALEGR